MNVSFNMIFLFNLTFSVNWSILSDCVAWDGFSGLTSPASTKGKRMVFLKISLVAQWVKNLSATQETACNAGDQNLIPGLGRFPEGGHGNPFQYSCLENSMDRGAWWGLQSMRLQSLEHDWSDNTHTCRANVYGQLSVNQTYDSSILWSPTHHRIYVFGVGNLPYIIFHFSSSTKTVV